MKYGQNFYTTIKNDSTTNNCVFFEGKNVFEKLKITQEKPIHLVNDAPLVKNCLRASLPTHFMLQLSHIDCIQKILYL